MFYNGNSKTRNETMPIELFYSVRSAFLFKIILAQTSLVFTATSIGIGPEV